MVKFLPGTLEASPSQSAGVVQVSDFEVDGGDPRGLHHDSQSEAFDVTTFVTSSGGMRTEGIAHQPPHDILAVMLGILQPL